MGVAPDGGSETDRPVEHHDVRFPAVQDVVGPHAVVGLLYALRLRQDVSRDKQPTPNADGPEVCARLIRAASVNTMSGESTPAK
jgi:hypothetical protein